MQRRIFTDVSDKLVRRAQADSELRAAFIRDLGTEPATGELQELTRQVVEQWEAHNGLFVERVQENHRFALERLVDMHSQRATLARLGRIAFVFADSPVVLTRGPLANRGTADQPIPFDEAENMWCPLSPTVGISFSTTPRADVVASPDGARLLNLQSWRYASRFLGARPGLDLDRAFATKAGTFDAND